MVGIHAWAESRNAQPLSTHVYNICSTATRTLNLSRRKIYRCSSESKSPAYTASVYGHTSSSQPVRGHDTRSKTAPSYKLYSVDLRALSNEITIARPQLHPPYTALRWTQLSERRTDVQGNSEPGCHPIDYLRRPTRFNRRSNPDAVIGISTKIKNIPIGMGYRTRWDKSRPSNLSGPPFIAPAADYSRRDTPDVTGTRPLLAKNRRTDVRPAPDIRSQ